MKKLLLIPFALLMFACGGKKEEKKEVLKKIRDKGIPESKSVGQSMIDVVDKKMEDSNI